jgi:hypothetical protein
MRIPDRRSSFMGSDKNNEIVEDEFSLSEYLMPDTPEVKEIKSLYEKEYEYSEYLSEIEFSIALHYYEDNRKLKDKDVISALKNIKLNRDKPLTFFKNDLEKEIVESLLEPLEENPITNHEFNLVIDYVLWVIDNRSWLEDKQAYVKWITYVLGFFSEEEEEKYEKWFKKFARKLGVSGAQVDMLLMKREITDDFFEEGDLFEDIDATRIFDEGRVADDLETGFCLMTDDEKIDFLMEHGPDYIELVQSYVVELVEKDEFEKLQDFYKKFSEKREDFFPLHFIMGTIYIDRHPALAKFYFEETMKAAEKAEELSKEMKESLRENIILLETLMSEESAEKPEQREKITDEGNKSKSGYKTKNKASKKDL